MRKRIFSILLTIAVCLSMMPAGVWANDGNVPEKGTDNLFKINTVEEFKTFQNKVNRGGTDKAVTLSTNSNGNEVSTENEHTNHCVCGGTANVNGHSHDTAGTVWTSTDSLPNSKGNYYLTQSVSGNWTVPTGDVKLCLNGKTISGSITVGTGATLTLTDCTNQGKIQDSNSSTGVTVNGGTFNMYGGTITGFTNGVQVGINGGTYQTGSTFTMYGGSISGNTATSGSGGGVFLVGTTNQTDPPRFTMHGGTISNNTAGGSNGGGGGVYVGEKCSFTMDGGTITGNTAAAGNGGGIYIHNLVTKTEISNALITNNKATATGNVNFGLGGGIYSQKNLTVNNSAITGNEAAYYGGGICGAGSITLANTIITGNRATQGNGGGVYASKMSSTSVTNQPLKVSGSTQIKDNAPNNYHVNEARQLPIKVTGALTDSAVIYVDVYEGLKPGYGGKLTIAEPASGVTLNANNFKADAADCVTGVDENGKVYLALCEHKMDDTGYTCKTCETEFDARIGNNEYYQTLSKAFMNESANSTVTLLRNVTLNANCSAASIYDMTLDLNGKTISSEDNLIGVGGGNNGRTLTVKDSSTSGGTQTLNVKFLVRSNSKLAIEGSYTGDISCVEMQAGGALERFGGKIGELILNKAANGVNSTNYNLKLWEDNSNCCTIDKITDSTANKSLTVNDLMETNHAKCEFYGEKDGEWNIVSKKTKISDLRGYTAYKVQFPECLHQCANDTAENPVCSKCGKELYIKITAKDTNSTTKTAYFTADSALENGYVEAVQTLNNWSNEGCTEATLILLRDMAYGTQLNLTGTLKIVGGTHTARNVTVAEDANVTFNSGTYCSVTVNGAATVKNNTVFHENNTVTVKGTLNAEGGTFNGNVKFESGSTANISGGNFNYEKKYGGIKFDGLIKEGTISDGTFAYADFYTTNVKLTGGMFTKININGGLKLADLLAEGAAYYSDDKPVNDDNVSALENVNVVSHTHNGGTDGSGICSICKKQMTASMTVDGKTSWYAAFASAIDAANEVDGEKTITLYQDVNGYVGKSTRYELTNGTVTLATGNKTVQYMELIAKNITLIITGSGKGNNSNFNVTADGVDAEVNVSDPQTKLSYVTAENSGKLSLSNGTFSGVWVSDDGSSASLSGGSYGEIKADSGYVKPYALLANGYAYKNQNGNWPINTSIGLKNVIVTEAPINIEKIYPNGSTNYTGNSFNVTDGNINLTAVVMPETENVTYQWQLFNSSTGNWVNSTYFKNINNATHSGADSKTLSITNLDKGTYQYRVLVKSSDGYQCYSDTFTVLSTEPQIADVNVEANKTYDGTDKLELSKSSINFLDAAGNDIDIPESDFSISDAKYTGSNAGTDKVEFTVTLTDSTNYVFADDNGKTKKFTCTVEGITKADAPADIKTDNITITNGYKADYTVDLSKLLPSVTTLCTYGTVTYGNTEFKSENLEEGESYGIFSSVNNNGQLKISVLLTSGSKTGKVGTVTVNVETTNYQDFTLTVDVYAKNKIKPASEGISADAITYGQKLSESKLSGLMKYGDKNVAGTFSWKDGNVKPDAGVKSYEWIFTPNDTDTYAEATGSVNVKVNPKNVTADMISNIDDVNYNGNQQKPAVVIKDGEKILTAGTDYILSYGENINAGKGTVKITGKGNYTGTASKDFTINKINQTAISFSENKTATYGQDLDLAVTGGSTDGNVTFEIVSDSSCTGTAEIAGSKLHPTKAGTVNVKATMAGNTNYNAVSVIDTFTINKATIDLSNVKWTEEHNFTYDGNVHEVELTNLPDTVTVNYADNEKAYAGSYTAKATLNYNKDNYQLSGTISDCQWSITAAEDPAVIADTAIVTKGGNTVDLSNNVTGAKGDITYRITSGLDGCSIDNSGVFTSGNTTGECTVAVTVAVKDINGDSTPEYSGKTGTITVTVSDKADAGVTLIGDIPTEKTYGDADFKLKAQAADTGSGNGNWKWTSGNSDVLQITGSGETATVKILKSGTVTITAEYESGTTLGSKTVTIKVVKRLINIKANNKNMTVNDTLPTFDVTYDGFVYGDTAETVFETQPTVSTAADGKTAGTFEITVTAPTIKSEMADKYDVGTLETGMLTVKAASSGGGAIIIPVQKPEIITGDGGKTDLSDDGTTIKITPDEGKEVDKVLVNGKDIGAVTEVKDLKPGDKVEVIFKDKVKEPAKEELDSKVKEALNDMALKARSAKTSKKNIRINVIASITDKLPDGYTVKYKYYRSTKKTSGYRFMTAKSENYYINTKGIKGTRYYYKVRVAVYDNDGKLIAQTDLKQCKYATRVWIKQSKSK